MPENLKTHYQELNSESRTPVWQFAGLALIVIAAVWIMISSKADKKNALVYLSQPQVGDVYEYKTDNGSYTTLKVARVTRDSIFVLENQYEVTRMTKVYTINKSENYMNEQYAYTREDLKGMYKSGMIYRVNRE